MSRIAKSIVAATVAEKSAPPDPREQFVCPFCGSVNVSADGSCPRCTMENSPAGRQATKARLGPWYVLQKKNPSAPGMKFETLVAFVRRGRVKPRSIVRGPTTNQFWRFAENVKGLSREFGVCYSCGEGLALTATICPKCNRLQEPPANPDVFLESMERDAAPVVYREIPFSEKPINLAPAVPAVSGASPESNHHPAAIDARQAPVTTAAAEPRAAAVVIEKAPPPAKVETESQSHEMVIPSLGAAPEKVEHDLIVPALGPATLPPPRKAAPVAPPPAPAVAPRPARVQEEPAIDDARTDDGADDGGHDDGNDYDDHFDDEGDAEWSGRYNAPVIAGGYAPPPRAVPRGRFWIEGTLFILVIAGALLVGLLYVDTQLREAATALTNRALASIGLVDSPSKQKAPTPSIPPLAQPPAFLLTLTKPRNVPRPAAGSSEPATAPAPTTRNVAVAPAKNVKQEVAPPATAPAPAPEVKAVPSAPPPVVEPAPATPSEITSAAQAKQDPPPAPADDDPFTRARTLRRKAIDAENSGDYGAAVSLFEQIKDLPREAWPGDLDLRLRVARQNAENAGHH